MNTFYEQALAEVMVREARNARPVSSYDWTVERSAWTGVLLCILHNLPLSSISELERLRPILRDVASAVDSLLEAAARFVDFNSTVAIACRSIKFEPSGEEDALARRYEAAHADFVRALKLLLENDRFSSRLLNDHLQVAMDKVIAAQVQLDLLNPEGR